MLATLLALSFMSCDPSTPKADNTGGGTGGNTTQSTTLTEVEVTARTMDLFIAASSESSGTASEASRSITIPSITIANTYTDPESGDSIEAGAEAALTITGGSFTVKITANVTLDGVKYSITGSAKGTISTDAGITVDNSFDLAINGTKVQKYTIESMLKRWSGETSAEAEIAQRMNTLVVSAINAGKAEVDASSLKEIVVTVNEDYTNTTNGDTILAGSKITVALDGSSLEIDARMFMDATSFTVSGKATVSNGTVDPNEIKINASVKVSDETILGILKSLNFSQTTPQA